jgi:hypothetical protein
MGNSEIPSNGKYLEDRRFILDKLDTLTTSIDKLTDTIHALDKRILVIETKSIMLGGGSAIIVTIIISIIKQHFMQ